MIVEQDFEETNDVFSTLGRASLVGGTAFAAHQAFKESSFGSRKGPRQDAFRKRISSLMKMNQRSQRETSAPSFFKSAFFNNLTDTNVSDIKYGSIDDLEKYLKGGYKGYSKTLGNDIRELMSQMKAVDGVMPSLSFRVNNNEASLVQLEGRGVKLRINPVASNGSVFSGRTGSNSYMTKQLWNKEAGSAVSFFGADVGLTRSLTKAYPSISSGLISPSQIYSAYESARTFDDKTSLVSNSKKTNPNIKNYIVNSAIEDPGLDVLKKAGIGSGGMNSKSKSAFMINEAIAGNAGTSASDYAKGVIVLDGNILKEVPLLDETANPKQLIKNVEHVDSSGSSFLTNKKTLFLNKKEMSALKGVLKNDGINLGELADEQLISNSNGVKIIDRNRSLTISNKASSDHSEFLLNKMAGIAGLSPDDFSSAISSGGLSSLPDHVAGKIREISLDDYGNSLIREKKDIKAKLGSAEELGLSPQQVDDLKASLASVDEKIKNKKFFGMRPDGLQQRKLKRSHRGLMIEDLSFQDGNITFDLRREKIMGSGDKIHDIAGEIKAIIKTDIKGLPQKLEAAFEIATGQKAKEGMFNDIDFVANESTLRKELSGRNANNVLHNSLGRAKRESNARLIHEIETYITNYSSIDPDKRMDVFKRIEEITGMPAAKYAMDRREYKGKSFGIFKEHIVSFGSSALDMGAGGTGSFTERTIKNFSSLGMSSLSAEIIQNRENPEALSALQEIARNDKKLKDLKNKNILNLSDLTDHDFEKLFTSDSEKIQDALSIRSDYLKSKGFGSSAVLDLGRDIGGTRRIPIYSDDVFKGYIGAQIGSAEGMRRYTDYEESVKRLIREMRNRAPDERKLEMLVNNVNTAQNQMVNSLKKKMISGKHKKAVIGLLNSAPDGLKEYNDYLNNYYGTKGGSGYLATMSDEEFIKSFGKDEYSSIKRKIRNFGKIDSTSDFSKLSSPLSNAWSMLTRFPEEGLSSIPANVLPASVFKGAPKMDGAISIMTSGDNSLILSLFGDTDGDLLASIPGIGKSAKNEIRELAYGNSSSSQSFRESQREKSKVKIKGQSDSNILNTSIFERREAVARAKELEKSNIGIISNRLEEIRNANHMVLANAKGTMSDSEFSRFVKASDALHIFGETAIKGKHQTIDQLRQGKTMEAMDALSGTGWAESASVSDRKKAFMRYLDELALGAEAEKGDAIRSLVKLSGNSDVDLIKKVQNLTMVKTMDGQALGWFRNIASDEVVDNIFNLIDKSKEIKSNVLDDALEMSIETVEELKGKVNIEKAMNLAEETKDYIKNTSGKIAKYALLPAIGLGLAGTIFGGRGEIRAGEKEFSDGQKKHISGSYSKREVISSPQMKKPKYERATIRGEANAGKINYSGLPDGSSVTLNDNTKNFDRYEIEEMLERGY